MDMDNAQNTPTNQPLNQPPSSPPSQNIYYAHSGFVPRLFAAIVDGVLILIVAFLIGYAYQLLTGESSGNGNSPFRILVGLITMLYEVTMVTLYGATLGKMLLRIKVVNTNYQKVSFIQVLKRETIGKILSGLAFNLGYLWVLVDDKKQSWHDKIAKTYVINTQPISHDEYMRQQESKRSYLPHILIFAGVVEALFMSIMALTVLPKLTTLYSEFGDTSYSPVISYALLGVGLVSSVAQFIYGLIIWNEQRKGAIQNNHKTVAKVLLIIGAILFTVLTPILIMSIILPIYNLTSQF